MKKVWIVLTALSLMLSLCACGGDTGEVEEKNDSQVSHSEEAETGEAKDEETVVVEKRKNGGVAYLTETGELLLQKELDGSEDAISLTVNGGVFASGRPYFTNEPADGDQTPAVVFSEDGSKLYYFTDIEDYKGVLRYADISKLKSGSDKNENHMEKLTTDVLRKLIVCGDGVAYEANKNGNFGLYYHDGNSVGKLRSDAEKVWLTDDGTLTSARGETIYYIDGTYDSNDVTYGDLYTYVKGESNLLARDIVVSHYDYNDYYVDGACINLYEDGVILAYTGYGRYGYELTMFDKKGDTTVVADDVTSYVRIDSSTVLLISDGNLYSYDGKEKTKLHSDVEYLWCKDSMAATTLY